MNSFLLFSANIKLNQIFTYTYFDILTNVPCNCILHKQISGILISDPFSIKRKNSLLVKGVLRRLIISFSV